jgi:hypothetical protein
VVAKIFFVCEEIDVTRGNTSSEKKKVGISRHQRAIITSLEYVKMVIIGLLVHLVALWRQQGIW